MAELAFVGDGKDTYQVWVGGSPVLTRTAWPLCTKMPEAELEIYFGKLLDMFKEQRTQFEAFGDFCHRVGEDAIKAYSGGLF
jgi:sulfite reductase (ferredoxin)